MVLKTSCSLFLFIVKSLPSPEWFTSARAYEPEQNQLAPNLSTSRRAFLGGAALTVVGLSLPVSVASDFIETKATRLTLGFHDLHRGVWDRRLSEKAPQWNQ